MKKYIPISVIVVCALLLVGCTAVKSTVSADDAIKNIYSYGFIDLEGAKLSAVIVEYDRDIDAKSVSASAYEIENYTLWQRSLIGDEAAIEQDFDDISGNEGEITRVYVNDTPAPSTTGAQKGRYVVIEVNTDYMLSAANLVYTMSMMAGLTQKADVGGKNGTITASDTVFRNYTSEEVETRRGTQTKISTDKTKILLPEFGEGSGWTLHYIGVDAFKATHCYSEYTGEYYDFELPYALYVPDQKTLDANKGNIALTIHMEHAGALDSDPMSAITSSRAAAMHAEFSRNGNPAIIVVPQIEESRRSTNDFDASSEANTAIWELMDWLLDEYKDYIDPNRIYGTGQSMGGMTILYMASQRDNFFGGIAVVGAQWSNNYDKPFQHNGAAARSPQNDTVSFNGFGLDSEHYQNWYYMISDDNILVHTCSGDVMSAGEWGDTAQYFAVAGVTIPFAEWDPYLPIEEQHELDRALLAHDTRTPGSGIIWGSFNKGSHMSTWKYGYHLRTPFEWLYKQSRESENARGKIEQLKNPWLGRNADGTIKAGSGTNGLNSAQYTPDGASDVFTEGWTVASVRK